MVGQVRGRLGHPLGAATWTETADRGTTSGLLVHDENDVGILGSLPSHVDKKLLES